MKKHIVIDARLYGTKHTGIGRYTKNLIINLPSSRFRYTLIVYPELLQEIKDDLGHKFDYLPTNIRHYSLQEQIFLPRLIKSLKPDLVHFTHFSKPILYLGKSVVTVHDLIRHFSKGTDTTTRSPWLYWLKYLGYLFQSWLIFKRDHVIVPSNYWRDYIINKYSLKPSKITTTYEAVDPILLAHKQATGSVKPQNYIIYTGNLYPHKNINIILEAIKSIPDIKLKVICGRSIFSDRIKSPQVEFLGYVPDEEFFQIYQSAIALIHPAFIEGFSLTGLEAMALNCPVIASNATCIPEIYGNAALYFDPNSTDQLIQQINLLRDNDQLRHKLIKLGRHQVQRYSWERTAKQTLAVYESILD